MTADLQDIYVAFAYDVEVWVQVQQQVQHLHSDIETLVLQPSVNYLFMFWSLKFSILVFGIFFFVVVTLFG